MSNECQFCKVKAVMQQIMNIIDENIPDEFGFYIDNAIVEVYNAANDALNCPTCECHEKESQT